jgi:hypothetical protein
MPKKNNLSDAEWYEILNSKSDQMADLENNEAIRAMATRDALIKRHKNLAVKEQIDDKKMMAIVQSKMIGEGLMKESPAKRYIAYVKSETSVWITTFVSIFLIISIPQLNIITRSDDVTWEKWGFIALIRPTSIISNNIPVLTRITEKDLALYAGEISGMALRAKISITIEPNHDGLTLTAFGLKKDDLIQLPFKSELDIQQNTSGNISIIISNK